MSDQFIKGGCTRCGGHIEFPAALAGSEVKCPHCAQLTTLADNLRATAAPAPAPASATSPQRRAAAKPEPPAPKVSQECPGCGLEASIAAEECPGCGALLKPAKRGVPAMALIAGAAVLVLALAAGAFVVLKKKPAGDAVDGAEGTATAAETQDDRFSMKAPERAVTLSGKFELLEHRIDRMPGRNLVYVVGTVTNGTAQQAFGVKVIFDLTDDSGRDAGQAQDQIATLPSGDAWEFRALVLDGKATKASLSALEKEME